MRNEDLIRSLMADRAHGPSPARRLLIGLALALGLTVAAMLVFLGVRPDLLGALTGPPVVKTALPVMLAGIGLALALRRASPAAPAGGFDLALGAVVALVALTLVGGVVTRGTGELAATLVQGHVARTLVAIPLLSAAPLAVVLWALRAGAPLGAPQAGALAGLIAGSLGAAVYSLSCPDDAALYFVPVYGVAIALVSLAGALLGARLLRW